MSFMYVPKMELLHKHCLVTVFLTNRRFYLFVFRQRGREREREEEKHQCEVVSCTPPTGDLACNPGMCPD